MCCSKKVFSWIFIEAGVFCMNYIFADAIFQKAYGLFYYAKKISEDEFISVIFKFLFNRK
ncbi:hypothetical protein CH362_16645 [Leptospira saintgironsiae]|uniref:Uncharacterized protein n=1 Tax=Leptospira saintgironsiae TaxID=2023183 RepID=A0A2M9Y8M5_9LEPT|nr:hypothetical protein CH362_16645 [Leptospira saintgironsiae]